MKKIILSGLLLTMMSLYSVSLHSQVTIGSGIEPMKGALLDLKEKADGISAKGLAMPRVVLTSNSNIANGDIGGVTAANKDSLLGLMVYNTGTITTSEATRLCPGMHVWTGDKWVPFMPYPAIGVERTLVSSTYNGFTHLDPANPADPNYAKWAELGKTPASYQLGYQGTFADNRAGDVAQTYHHTRYYVGYTTKTELYDVRTSYSCDPAAPSWGAVTPETKIIPLFEDGIWMGEHLRAQVMDPTRDKAEDTPIALVAHNYPVAINYAYASWAYPNRVAANKATLGLLYTWAAATNAKGGANGQQNAIDEAGVLEGVQRQGICPTGWHLPSDREFTDLENGIILHTDLFSSTPVIGTMLDYTNISTRGSHGTPMAPVGAGANKGTSKEPVDGGFKFGLAGRTSLSVSEFGVSGYLWTSSSNSAIYAWYRHLGLSSPSVGIARSWSNRYDLLSVRCKKNS